MDFVWFDERFSYYDNSHEVTNKDDNNTKFGDIWNEVDDDKFVKVIAKKQERSIAANSEEERDNNGLSESTIDINHLLPNQPIVSPIVPKETLSPLPNSSRANTVIGST